MQRTLNIPDTFEATSRGITATMDMTKVTDEIIVNMIMAWQGLADSASGAAKDAAIGANVATAEGYAVWTKTEAAKDWSMSEAGRMAIAESTERLMVKKATAIEAGTWEARGESSGVSTEVRIGRSLMKAMMKAKADSKAWAAFTGLTDAAQNEKIDTNIAKNADAMAVKVKAEIARLEALRAAKAKIAEGMTISL